MDSTLFTTESRDGARPFGRFSRWLSLTFLTGLCLWTLHLGPYGHSSSQADDNTGSVTSSNAANGTSSARPAQEAKRSEHTKSPAPDRVALRANDSTERPKRRETAVAASSTRSGDGGAIGRALEVIAECQGRYRVITDYTCTFYKRERLGGRLTGLHVMTMKIRRQPSSIYVKFQQPGAGREAIYIAGRNAGKVLAHDVGFNKLLAGTLALDPKSARAMEDNRHPITEAGIGPLLDTLASRWATELDPEESIVVLRDDALVAQQHCHLIEVTHPHRRHHFLHHRVRVYIDKRLGLPIRFEAYDWPKKPDVPGELTEEYTYMNLRLNVGLREIDFDAANPEYSFGRL